MNMNEREKQRRLKGLTKRERQVLEVICRHKDKQLQQIVAQGLIRKDDGQPIKFGTLKTYMQRLYDKLGVESRDRMGVEREYCHLIESGDMRWPTKQLILLFASLAVILFVILAIYVFGSDSPPSIPCENLELAQEIFPQLKEVVLLEPFSDKEHSRVFRCEGVQDIVHNASLSAHLSFEDVGEPEQYGYFGIGGLDGLDISFYTEFCVQAYAEEPQQSFWMNMIDVISPVGYDGRVPVVVPATFSWEEICVGLKQYENQGIDLSQMENVSFGFDNRTGTAEIWIGGLEFR